MTALPRLAGRVALITGASRGIGAAVARRFASEGARLILTARTAGGLEEVDDRIRSAVGREAAPTLAVHDLADTEDIDRLAAAVAERFGRLDILVGNAALLGTLGPIHQTTPEEWERVLAVNLTANWRLIRAFDPILRAVENGRAVFVGEADTGGGRPYWGPYAVAKAALQAMVLTWAAETRKTRLRVNMVAPGPTRTAMRSAAFPGEDLAALAPPDALADLFVELAAPTCSRHGAVLKRWAVAAAADQPPPGA